MVNLDLCTVKLQYPIISEFKNQKYLNLPGRFKQYQLERKKEIKKTTNRIEETKKLHNKKKTKTKCVCLLQATKGSTNQRLLGRLGLIKPANFKLF